LNCFKDKRAQIGFGLLRKADESAFLFGMKTGKRYSGGHEMSTRLWAEVKFKEYSNRMDRMSRM
jgi:hypothetical protein